MSSNSLLSNPFIIGGIIIGVGYLLYRTGLFDSILGRR